ncbi:MAG: patatin-like phospholipase family protein [Phycisphaerales bacterium]|jgi:NTE family protein
MKANIIIEGGGVRGIAAAVALHTLELNGYDGAGYAGASAGSMIAAFRAYGYSYNGIYEIYGHHIEQKKLRDINPLAWLRGGLCAGNYLEQKADEILDGATFEDIPTPLRIVSADMTNGKIEVFSRETSPEMNVAQAIRLSCSIPLFYRWGTYNGKLYWDPGMIYNFPAHIFNDDKKTERVGIILKSTGENAPFKKWELRLFVPAFLKLVMRASEQLHIEDDDWKNIALIDTENIKATQFELSYSDIWTLVSGGIVGALDFLEKKRGRRMADLKVPDAQKIVNTLHGEKDTLGRSPLVQQKAPLSTGRLCFAD